MGELTCRRLIASPALDINSLELKGLNLFEEAPRAEPHAGCCGSGGRKSPCYPISLHLDLLALHQSLVAKSAEHEEHEL